MQEAVATCIATGAPSWNPRTTPLQMHLKSIINGALRNAWKHAAHEPKAPPLAEDAAGNEIILNERATTDLTPKGRTSVRELLGKCLGPVQKRFGDRAADYLLVACDARADQAETLGVSVKQMYHLQEDLVALCEEVEAHAGVDFFMERRGKERVALERSIEETLPRRVRPSAWREPTTWIAIALAVLALALVVSRCAR